ncbi:MAG TPA: DUF58 domain-containing protein [Gaiellaceae bacterium]|jgi:uncharacterized protein (DUF58 family)
MTRYVAPRLAGYATLAAVGLIAGIALGRVELIALAAPFALVAALGALWAGEPRVELSLALARDRVIEGDDVKAMLELRSETGADRLDLALLLPGPLDVAPGRHPLALRLRPGETRTVDLDLHCRRWGAFAVGGAVVRIRDRLGLYTWEGRTGERAALRVYPRQERLRALLAPLETQVFGGNQVSRDRSEGIEFADVRPFVPGDRVRKVNWRATARRGSLLVNDHHPERNTDVILFLDTFADARAGDRGTLDLAVRAASSLADRYLRRKDRVGLVSFGGYLTWLLPSSGIVQRYRIVDSLLQSEIVLTYAAKGVDVLPPRTLPPKALVLALSPLLDQRSAASLVDLRARGYDLVVVEVSPLPFVDPGRDELQRLAYRIWELSRDSLRARYADLGVPVIEWREGAPLDAAIEEVRTFRHRARPARA